MPEEARSVESLPWIEDGIGNAPEFNAARGLILMAKAGYLPSLLEEPWVVDGSNYAALESLWVLQNSTPEKLARIMSHPIIGDGISDQEANIVAVITPGSPPDRVDKLLDPAQVTLEERTITLPLAGETDISIVRTGPGTDHAIESLVHAVRSIEEFMGLPFPRRQVLYIFTVYENPPFGGKHYGNHVKIFLDDKSIGKESTASIVAHEASHYYWKYGRDWMNEGAATFFESIANNTTSGPLSRDPCPLARSITELEDLERELSNPEEVRFCHYRLGERLFRDLYRNMHETTFRLGFRRLFLHTLHPVSDECNDDRLTDCHVKEAFTAYAPAEKASIIEKVIDRWYDGSEPYDLSEINETAVEPDIAAIDGRIEEAYLSISRGGPPVPVVVAGPNRNAAIYLNLDYSYQNSSGLTSLPIEIATYFEDGFEFQRTVSELDLSAETSRQTHHVHIRYARVPGQYWVQVHSGGQKIAQATFEAIPEPDPHSIRGMVTGPDGRPTANKVELRFTQGEEHFLTEARADGDFDVEVSPGSFTVEVRVLIDNHWNFVGWYDGTGITTDPAQVFEITVDDEDIEGIEIMFPTDMVYHSVRGVLTYTGDQPLDGIALQLRQGDERFWVETGMDGTFDAKVSPGSFILEVNVLFGTHWHFAGWYDGTSITTDPAQASNIIVDDVDVEGIEIILSPEDIPDPDPPNIRGVVTGLGGQPLDNVGLSLKQEEEKTWVETGPDGTFDVEVSSGTFTLEVYVLSGTQFDFVGWYDGSGGITTDRSQAFEVVVDDADIEGIEIKLPTQP